MKMDPPLVNESSFSTANPSAYSLAEIWQFGGASDGVLGLRTGNLGRHLGGLAEGSGNLDGSAEESTVTEQSGGGGKRKRVDVSSEDESSKMVSSSSATNLHDSSGKRMKIGESRDENGGAKAEETSSANGNKPGEPISKTLEPPKDYIHVRARRGQATDSHSLAERARREKISERMKILQDLVPGCNKVIGKAFVLDEIINYIQSLQCQVEFLSMKLEAVNSRINRNPGNEGYTTKDVDGTQAFDAAGMIYGSQAIPREYGQGQGLQPEWVHMQIGGTGFERSN